MIEFISFAIFVLLFIYTVFLTAQLKMDNMRLAQISLQLAIDKSELLKKLEESLVIKADAKVTENEGFLNFISQSRDWAYEYIENVQENIANFVNDIEPEISYFDEYGLVGDAYPHYHSMKKISESYKKLKSALPDDYDRIDK